MGARGAAIAVANYKGGVGKSTIAAHRAAHELARELGIWFAELQNVALLLVTDPKSRSQETEALLERIRGPR